MWKKKKKGSDEKTQDKKEEKKTEEKEQIIHCSHFSLYRYAHRHKSVMFLALIFWS